MDEDFHLEQSTDDTRLLIDIAAGANGLPAAVKAIFETASKQTSNSIKSLAEVCLQVLKLDDVDWLDEFQIELTKQSAVVVNEATLILLRNENDDGESAEESQVKRMKVERICDFVAHLVAFKILDPFNALKLARACLSQPNVPNLRVLHNLLDTTSERLNTFKFRMLTNDLCMKLCRLVGEVPISGSESDPIYDELRRFIISRREQIAQRV